MATQIEIQRKGTFWVTWIAAPSEELAIFLAFKYIYIHTQPTAVLIVIDRHIMYSYVISTHILVYIL